MGSTKQDGLHEEHGPLLPLLPSRQPADVAEDPGDTRTSARSTLMSLDGHPSTWERKPSEGSMMMSAECSNTWERLPSSQPDVLILDDGCPSLDSPDALSLDDGEPSLASYESRQPSKQPHLLVDDWLPSPASCFCPPSVANTTPPEAEASEPSPAGWFDSPRSEPHISQVLNEWVRASSKSPRSSFMTFYRPKDLLTGVPLSPDRNMHRRHEQRIRSFLEDVSKNPGRIKNKVAKRRQDAGMVDDDEEAKTGWMKEATAKAKGKVQSFLRQIS